MQKPLLLLTLILLISCNKNIKNPSENISVVDFDVDSIFYKVDLSQSENKTTFLIVKKIYVNDSCFGIYSSYNNVRRAAKYAVSIKRQYFYVHELLVKGKFGYKKLWNLVESSAHPDVYSDLQSDTKYHTIKDTNEIITDYVFLKIVRKQKKFSGETFSLNFKFDRNFSWHLISKERIVTDENLQRSIGYCRDTISKLLTESDDVGNEINFDIAFSKFELICNEGLQN
jgi:hypothetical protein